MRGRNINTMVTVKVAETLLDPGNERLYQVKDLWFMVFGASG